MSFPMDTLLLKNLKILIVAAGPPLTVIIKCDYSSLICVDISSNANFSSSQRHCWD